MDAEICFSSEFQGEIRLEPHGEPAQPMSWQGKKYLLKEVVVSVSCCQEGALDDDSSKTQSWVLERRTAITFDSNFKERE